MSAKKLTELHNTLAKEFVQKAMREILVNGGTFADVMLLMESVIVGGMVANVKIFKLNPQNASSMAEAAVQRAMERFTEQMNKDGGR